MKNNFYTATLMGGLGNQMFQVAHAICQGWKHNVPVSFPASSSTPNQGNQPTSYLNNIFRKVDFTGKKGETVICGERSWNDANLEFNVDDSVEFYGYFQSSKNFLGYSQEVIDLFSPSEEFLEKISDLYKNFNINKSVSVHVRRGDYLRFSDVHGIVDMSYINHCLSKCDEDSQIYIFTEDKSWAKEVFDDSKFIIVDGLQDYEELWFISLCRTNIMSCSSFSWWGSFLNRNKNKVTYVPNKWFGPSGPQPYFNIFEKDWNQINVKFNEGFLFLDVN